MKLTKYRKTIPWTANVAKVVENGALQLQAGQWVQLPWLNTPSRFVGVRKSGSVWMVHTYNKHGKAVMDGGNTRFSAMCQSFKR